LGVLKAFFPKTHFNWFLSWQPAFVSQENSSARRIFAAVSFCKQANQKIHLATSASVFRYFKPFIPVVT